MITLRAALTRIANAHPETRVHLVPLLRHHAACACGDEMVAEDGDMGDELMGGRTWGNPDPRAKPDDATPYNLHPDSPPAGADGSPARKQYNKWFRENVCPNHKTNCGLPGAKG